MQLKVGLVILQEKLSQIKIETSLVSKVRHYGHQMIVFMRLQDNWLGNQVLVNTQHLTNTIGLRRQFVLMVIKYIMVIQIL